MTKSERGIGCQLVALQESVSLSLHVYVVGDWVYVWTLTLSLHVYGVGGWVDV